MGTEIEILEQYRARKERLDRAAQVLATILTVVLLGIPLAIQVAARLVHSTVSVFFNSFLAAVHEFSAGLHIRKLIRLVF